MPSITYSANGFPTTYAPALAGIRTLSVTWPEIVWAAISVGKAQLQDLALYGVFSALEMTYRTAIIYANLQETADGRIRRSAAYDGLDPSEKGAISYFIGLTAAKLMAGRLMSVPWLMHLDVYRNVLGAVLLAGSKPDMVGLTSSGQWVVIEAKGRTNRFEPATLAKAKDQTMQLTTIQGAAPVLRAASLSYFEGGVLEVALEDPEGTTERIPNLPLTPELIIESYYRPFRSRIEQTLAVGYENIQGQTFRVAHFPEIDMWIGLSETTTQPTTAQELGAAREIVGPDGILVRLGSAWSDENMRLQPQERQRR